MRKRNLFIALGLVAVAGTVAFSTRSSWMDTGGAAKAQGPGRVRAISIQAAIAERKQVPVEVDAIGTVTPIASVALKSRIETTITEVHFQDGARVKAGDILFTLDARQIDAQIAQAEGTLARDRSQLAGAERDFRRYSDLIAKGATTQVNVDNAQTQMDILRGTVRADESVLENLKVQKSYATIRAPISGRISAANVKVGNFVRPADVAPLATINQIAPIYVALTVPQRVLPDLHESLKAGTAIAIASLPGDKATETGKVAMIENTVDINTGMVTLRAVMDNDKETLWPGTLVSTKLVVRNEEAVVVPSVAVQRSQAGNFVFLVKDGKAQVQPVTVARTFQGSSVISSGLSGGENVVTDGQMLLSNGTPVDIRDRKTGA
ncbi:hemolysin D [Afipia sp. P52-10]|jgi:RND family efflux transporter MFP subunit|uniref:efflux RND transporter periplasmic adaptor subunit n=1 Tax=Afipia sp. P52-10 TaxID=1429916 RepID=UPI0003DF0ECE|nr:efflux RND transporter periplasmic adaptor subunit [Afipia sp. P52-10]ETR75260.1 hemolysin D [Afipia sp. P52-10]